ncbi:MAG: homoserine O-succinyltransferase [Alphaproteobacteria bacterium]|nr:homoserine O-succinyltransferase [Alphaproteobacteria bacterium]MBV9695275.1 homoserine O-succinyltransferase [Alphaproteobacteria bacterium]
MPAILQRARPGRAPDGIRVGIVNNMPDKALLSTARQFLNAIEAASPDFRVHVTLYSLSALPRDEAGRRHLADNSYQDLSQLMAADLDAVIVTGTEPRADDLREEPYWPQLSGLFDWIAREGPPAAFSCLAAHAAVLHFDGVERRPLAHKRFGLFEHGKCAHDPLTARLPASFKVAHSRWNELPAEALGAHGYRILTESAEAGVELFVREGRNRLLFFQGHPEYDSRTLGREYHRDVKRFLAGERDDYPDVPRNYFNATEKELLDHFRGRALRERNPALIDRFPRLPDRLATAGPVAGTVYGAWLGGLEAARKQAAPRFAGAGHGA